MTTPQVGEIWYASGLWKGEEIESVRVMEITGTGYVDVNYELDPSKEQDLRILPISHLLHLKEPVR